jgi:Leucine-rich repeat (LRR) protein
MKKLILIIALFITSFHAFSQNEYAILLQEAKEMITKQEYYKAIKHMQIAKKNYARLKWHTDSADFYIDRCVDGINNLLAYAREQEQKALTALARAEEMQRKVETAMFDKAVKERNKEWKGYDRYDWWDYNDDTKKGKEILEKIDSLNLSENALLRIPTEVLKCPNLKHINLLGNHTINWQQSEEILNKLNPKTGLYVSIKDLSDIDSSYWHLITGIEILKNRLDCIPANLLDQNQLEYLDLSSDGYYNRNKFSTLPEKLFQLQQLKYLNLRLCEITALPPEIGKLSRLKSLDLRWNQLTALPPEIEKLTGLTSLDLNLNKFIVLPPEIGKLSGLKSLDLSRNQLTTLPPEIGKLSALTSLYLNRNKLTTLPPEIGKLSRLTSLQLGSDDWSTYKNQLTTLPPEIGKLSMLTSLDLRNNQLTALPSEIVKLSVLTSLNLGGNKLTALPPEIVKFSELTSLDLNSNQLTALPPEIVKLSVLTSLNLGGNKLTALPPEILKLSGLESLDLSRNQLTALPPEIVKLSGLTSLDLFYNQLTFLPLEIGKLSNLTILDLFGNDSLNIASVCIAFADYSRKIRVSTYVNAGNSDKDVLLIKLPKLTILPQEIVMLSGLTSLDLTENQLTTLPPVIVMLSKLTSLDLSENKLTYLPPEIVKLSELRSLDLGKNKLTAMPPEIGKLTNLTELKIEGNPFKPLPLEFFSLPVTNKIDYSSWLKECSENKNYDLALSIRKGIMNKNFDRINDYAGISWYLIFCNDFEGAIWAGEQYVTKGGKSIVYLSNLAMGYLYNGNYDRALAIYKQYKNEKDKYRMKEIFLKDLEDVKAGGILPKKQEDVDKIIRYLNE